MVKWKRGITWNEQVEIDRMVRKFLAAGYEIDEIINELKANGIPSNKHMIHRFIKNYKAELTDEVLVWKLIAERVEKKKMLEAEAIGLYLKSKETGDLRVQLFSLRILKEIQKDAEDFLSRFNILPQLIQPQVVIEQKIDANALISQIKKELDSCRKQEAITGIAQKSESQ